MSTEVVSLLNNVHEIAAHACGSAPQGMAERWAEEYVAGNYERREDELNAGAKGYNNEGGASLIVSTHHWDQDVSADCRFNTEDRRQLQALARVLERHFALVARRL
jgi:hypothetical protein